MSEVEPKPLVAPSLGDDLGEVERGVLLLRVRARVGWGGWRVRARVCVCVLCGGARCGVRGCAVRGEGCVVGGRGG